MSRSPVNDPDNNRWAEIYDSIFSYAREDIPYYVEEAQRADGPVLELWCRTGRVTIPIAEAGVDIVGLDPSSAMLDVARRKMGRLEGRGGSLTLLQADPRDFSQELDRKFNLVIIPFHGFLSLLTVDDEIRSLRNIFRHLMPGGKLIINVTVPDLDTLVQDGDVPYHLRDVTDPNTETRFILWERSSYDDYSQVADIRTIVEELSEEGEVRRRLYRDHRMRYIFRWEMQHLIRLCGYEVLSLFGDFDRTPFDATSIEMVWVVGARS